MIGLEHDTCSAEVEHYYDLLRELSPAMRLRAASSACRRVRRFAEAGIRHRHPRADDREIKIRLTALLYGPDVAVRLFGGAPPASHE